MNDFEAMFRQATGGDSPYPYQRRLAESAELPWTIRVPTGAGKTAAAVLGWLHRRRTKPRETPRRLVYVLPMRVLVEQSERAARRWLEKLDLDDRISLHVLMGGAEKSGWYLQPEAPAILIGTQDMLLSRALNRGYSAGRFHWPIDFGLLNNDCWWVFDEPQLMAAGLATSAQLDGFRQSLGVFGACASTWMSATLEPAWLRTVDFVDRPGAVSIELQADDLDESLPLQRRMHADKTLEKLDVASSRDMKDVAVRTLDLHQPQTQTLLIVNTVQRARAAYEQLQGLLKKQKRKDVQLLLVHSRFRPAERRELNRRLQLAGDDSKDRILVATQVVEAGVDISARTLVTELAPWSSIVQRIGRCNRTGDDGPGLVRWIDLDAKLAAPYDSPEIDQARELLESLEGRSVSPQALQQFADQRRLRPQFEHRHVLRRRDLLELFDTTPDLSGADVDISRYVRGDDRDSDLQVFWRSAPAVAAEETPPEPLPEGDELCSVPLGELRDFLTARLDRRRPQAFLWDHLDDAWAPVDVRNLRPGQVVLLDYRLGGYSPDSGWDPESKAEVEVVKPPETAVEPEGVDSDPNSTLACRLTLLDHTRNVQTELRRLLADLPIDDELRSQLDAAANWHDLGKAHFVFADAVRRLNPDLDPQATWAKSGRNGRLRYSRRGFRHEVASALAVVQGEQPFLVAYLVASHHGRARLALRALPDEPPPEKPDVLFALGVHDGDELPAVELPDGTSPALTLDLSPVLLGGESSWTAAADRLLEALGPFRLAFLEALLRAADVTASMKEANRG